ncbi:MAG: dockerin type I repeat-containing protein [Alloprevotella sp.]|nr:dockerin type I repeat-containing protein [Alloprevotella sp.]
MKKLLSALVLFLTAAAASADSWLTIGNLGLRAGYDYDTEYFDKNLNVPFKGKISFRAPNRLIFESVNMSLQGVQIDADGVEDFTIELHGENRIQAPTTNPIKSNTSLRFEAADDDASLTITGGYSNGYGLVYLTGGGDLVFSGGTYDFSGESRAVSQHPGDAEAGTLRFENCTVRLKAYGNAASGFRRVQYANCKVVSPEGAYYTASAGYQTASGGEAVKEVRIEPAYDLWVGGELVTKENKADILSDGGTASYDPATNTLFLRGADIAVSGADEFGIYSLQAGGLTVSLSGTNRVASSDWTGIYASRGVTLLGPGQLTLNGYHGISVGTSSTIAVRDGADVLIGAASRGIMGSTNRKGTLYYTTLTVDGSGTHLNVTAPGGAVTILKDVELGPGLGITYPNGGWFSEDSHAICDVSGEVATTVVIASAGSRYDLNGDGSVDVSDVTLLVAAVLADGAVPAAYDLNGDTGVDIGDVTELVSAVLAQ